MSISGKEVALILSENFDAVQFNNLHDCLLGAGALISIVGETPGQKLSDFSRKTEITVGVSFEEARSYAFDAAIISNGYAPDEIRSTDEALNFVKDLYNTDRVVAAIDHGPQVLISMGILKGKNVTGAPSIRVDLENAGANYFDEPVVVDGNIVTARGPSDLKELCNAIIEEFERPAGAAA